AQLDNGSELPAWLIFNAETRTFSGTPESIDVLDINVTATDKLGESATESFVLTVSGSSAVGYISDKIEIYPNPTSDFIFVKQDLNSGNNSLISITDITGKIIYKTKINSNIFRINVSDYTAGTYFVKIQTGTKILREKIVIQK
ncbi:MAG: hypothetical protein DRI94_10000, partial [Bacteroidetes bacterium]